MDGDGDLDLIAGQFGYDQGEIRWMENVGPWQYESHSLLQLSGLINVCVDDFNGDRHSDIAAQFSNNGKRSISLKTTGRAISPAR